MASISSRPQWVKSANIKYLFQLKRVNKVIKCLDLNFTATRDLYWIHIGMIGSNNYISYLSDPKTGIFRNNQANTMAAKALAKLSSAM